MIFKSVTKTLLLVTLFFSQHDIVSQTSDQLNKIESFKIVDTTNLMNIVQFFASPDLKGRLPGTREYDLAGRFAEKYFEGIGVQSFPGHNNYRQTMPIKMNKFIGPCKLEIIHPEKGIIKPIHGKNYSFRGYTGSGNKTLETVFCGYGIDTEDYSDYKDIDVEGKAVIIYKANPSFDDDDFDRFSIGGRAHTAKRNGAAAVIFIPTPTSPRSKPIGSVMFGDYDYIDNMPMLEIDYETIDYLIDGSGYTQNQLFDTINSTQKPFSVNLKSDIKINVQTKFYESVETFNIVGYIPGNGTLLSEEYLVVSAHLDHVGYQCEVIYPGANDNASGCAAVLELARIFIQNPTKRSIIFILYTGEEQGIIGANYFAENLPVDKEKIVAAFNFDCIASGDSIQIGNGLSNPKLYETVKSKDRKNLMVDGTWRGGGADLTPLYNIGIPGLYFVTRYSYTHLHLPSDTPETLNVPLFKDIVRLGYETIKTVANGYYDKEDIKN